MGWVGRGSELGLEFKVGVGTRFGIGNRVGDRFGLRVTGVKVRGVVRVRIKAGARARARRRLRF